MQVSGLFSAEGAGIGNAPRGRGRDVQEEDAADDADNADELPMASDTRQAVVYNDLWKLLSELLFCWFFQIN